MRIRHEVPEIEMKDVLNFSAIAHSDKQISRQISTVVFSNALVETLSVKLGDSALYVLSRSYRKNRRNYSFSLHVIFKRSRHSSLLLR